ncbi:nucleolar protein 5 nucleolar protein nop5 nop58 [Holotrichia oblita]|uniref:Nucleolar protein 5 nucleolar protein nop5 nop58 n=2 Tax=Holotrichia oblita TaxID=644536 RepID=A0ACB9T139_HOLOL|nr:nucleolar protein 5 nucleolar protein nop5 nop58 [Holotrichia oblita]
MSVIHNQRKRESTEPKRRKPNSICVGKHKCNFEGMVPEHLQQFLDITVPKGSKKNKVTLGVSDSKLGAAITEVLGIPCSFIGVAPEVLRGIRHHFPKLVKGFTAQTSAVAQLALGHSYSRAKVKFNVNRVDNMIIQSIALVDQLDKDINTFSMRIREWYSYHFPELYKIVPENYTYSKLVQLIKNRKELSEESLESLEEITMDSGKAQAILDAARSSMGMDISPVDLLNIEFCVNREQVGARLISHAGSLTNLAKYPASTVQILGAEKALFRALKTRGNTPKYGLLFHSTFIGRAGTRNKGRISRYLANKCSIASRIDCFAEATTNIFGEKLKQQVEDRLKFYETGDIPKKNEEVMKEALEEYEKDIQMKADKKKKKKKKRKSETQDGGDVQPHENGEAAENGIEGEPPKKKKKKNKKAKQEIDE